MDMTQIDRMDARLNRAGSSLFFHPLTTEHAASRGIDNVFVLYGGRAGVMGDVGPWPSARCDLRTGASGWTS
jgi:hypothetical protein